MNSQQRFKLGIMNPFKCQDYDVMKQAITEAVKSFLQKSWSHSFEIAHSNFICMINKNTKGVRGHQWVWKVCLVSVSPKLLNSQ